MKRRVIFFGTVLLCLTHHFVDARIEDTGPGEKGGPLEIGNYSLPTSQQPSSLIAFGQNIIEKNDLLLFLYVDQSKGKQRNFLELFPYFVYGIKDTLSILVATPYLIKNRRGADCSSGIEDIIVQFEYLLYKWENLRGAVQITGVSAILCPSGSSTKIPPTGFGSSSFFLGGTFNYQALYWNVFTAQGVLLTTSHKAGNQYFYQFGTERVLGTLPGWLFACFLELDGYFVQHNMIDGLVDPDSGGNSIYLTPSIWISSERIILQFGVGVPIVQNLNGDQNKYSYMWATSFAFKWSF